MELTQEHISQLVDCAEKLPALMKQVQMLLTRKSPVETEWITKAEACALLCRGNGKPCSPRTLNRLSDALVIKTNGNRGPNRTVRYSRSDILKHLSNIDRHGFN